MVVPILSLFIERYKIFKVCSQNKRRVAIESPYYTQVKNVTESGTIDKSK